MVYYCVWLFSTTPDPIINADHFQVHIYLVSNLEFHISANTSLLLPCPIHSTYSSITLSVLYDLCLIPQQFPVTLRGLLTIQQVCDPHTETSVGGFCMWGKSGWAEQRIFLHDVSLDPFPPVVLVVSPPYPTGYCWPRRLMFIGPCEVWRLVRERV